jgi:hypothetical protein
VDTEIRSAAIGFNNYDPVNPATIESLTIYDFFGVKIHESFAGGPPHPTNTDFTGGVDITTVPPNAAYYLRTNHIWNNASIPGGNSLGFSMTAVIVFSKDGNPKLFSVGTKGITRALSAGVEGIEHARDSNTCY